MNSLTSPSNYQLIYAAVRQIPKGRVATYGQIAELAGLPRQARQVGYALHSLPPRSTVPWHRVVNSQGKISLRGAGDADSRQKLRLQSEGVKFSKSGAIDLKLYRWQA
ncbi:MAG: MGMT family protein [Steroidobacteraceae bacterium]